MAIDYQQLIAKKLSEGLSPGEEKELEQWAEEHPSNKLHLGEMIRLWELAGKRKTGFEPDTEKAWQRLRERMSSNAVKNTAVSRPLWLKIAAAVILVIGLGVLIRNLLPEEKAVTAPVVMAQIRTEDSVKVFFLPDSSKIVLNKNSGFGYPEEFNDTVRSVILTGEAFFEVRHDPARPFIIKAGNTETRVLGTSFNVKAYENEEEVQVMVVSGKVQFSPKDSMDTAPIVLNAEDQVTYSKTKMSLTKEKARNKNMWWKKIDLEKKVDQLFDDARRELNRLKKKK
jgi:transmembrane sensor